jgi:shikimate dehydrogenase
MYPNEDSMPEIPIRLLNSSHLVLDMVYNPAETMLMRQAKSQGATVCNGTEMLEIQARLSWDIWNE